MEIPVETWYEAIFNRRSRRKYESTKLSEEKMERLASACRSFRPFPEVRAVLVREPDERIYRGFIGSYGKIENAPHYIAFVGDMESPQVQEYIGYTGEAIILEATALGLGTCWVGGYFHPENVIQQISIEQNERILAITPVGIPRHSLTMEEKLMIGVARLHKRKKLKELVSGTPDKDWMLKALEAARIAPSAVNRQPWRFVIGDNSIAVRTDKNRDTDKISRRLDCGIAMLHLELGARHAGTSGKWAFPDDCVARFEAESSPQTR
jgi:nitroreductase